MGDKNMKYRMTRCKKSFIGHYVGEIVHYKSWNGFDHECVITSLWTDPDTGKPGVAIIPTGDYGFEINVYEDQLENV